VLTTPRVIPVWASVTGANSTVAVPPFGSSETVRVSTRRPSISRVTGSAGFASSSWLTRRAVATARSRPAASVRMKETEPTTTLDRSVSPMETGVITVPAGKRIDLASPASFSHPFRWKSEITTTSRRGCGEALRSRSAKRKAGVKRVERELGSAAPRAARSIALSGEDSTTASLRESKRIRETRSFIRIPSMRSDASRFARSHRSP
jgi:hypothetical protein